MLKLKATVGISLLIAASLILAACQQATPAPTLDANAIYTQAAGTVAAGLAMTKASMPSETPMPPTATLAPSSTPALTPTVDAAQLTATVGAGTPSPTVFAVTQLPSATKASGGLPAAPDQAEYVAQDPADNTKFPKNTKVTVKFVMKNTGPTTWTTDYKLRYYAGEKMGSPDSVSLPKDVKPNDTVEIVFGVTAPDKKGLTNTIWVLTNKDGLNFASVYLQLEITD
ncbi:MAG: hypothetical protein HY835_04150 [Anaerolineae bacterium]|nr:hypothetical protein [Anaerolineae bacterium]